MRAAFTDSAQREMPPVDLGADGYDEVHDFGFAAGKLSGHHPDSVAMGTQCGTGLQGRVIKHVGELSGSVISCAGKTDRSHVHSRISVVVDVDRDAGPDTVGLLVHVEGNEPGGMHGDAIENVRVVVVADRKWSLAAGYFLVAGSQEQD